MEDMGECPQTFLPEWLNFLPIPLLFPHPLPQDMIPSLELATHTWNLSPKHHADWKWILPEITGQLTHQGHIQLEQRGKWWVATGSDRTRRSPPGADTNVSSIAWPICYPEFLFLSEWATYMTRWYIHTVWGKTSAKGYAMGMVSLSLLS